MSQLPGLSRETRESIAMYHLRVPQTEEELERLLSVSLGNVA